MCAAAAEAHLVASLPALKAEGCGDDAHCEDAHLLGDGGDDRGSTTAGASAHTSLRTDALAAKHRRVPAR